MSASCTVRANAKLTLSLRVVGRRPYGYHELDALVVSLTEPHDSLTVALADVAAITVTGPFAGGVPTGRDNLACRAARALDVSVAIALHKGIPPAAGLGGGSADAAAVLRAAQALARPDLDDGALAAAGARLGADVPACLRGGRLRVRGIGEILEPATLPDVWIVTATPPFGCATAAVYAAWDAAGGPQGRLVDPGVAGLGPLVNDLEAAAHAVEPRLARFRDELEQIVGSPAILAGSGSSYALVFGAEAVARAAKDMLTERIGARCAHSSVARIAAAGVEPQPQG